VGHVDGSSVICFCPLLEVITLLLLLDTTHAPVDTGETSSASSAGNVGTGPTIKLSGADLVDVSGNFDSGDKVFTAGLTVSASAADVSVMLEKLLNQLSRLSATSVCASDDPDSGASA